MNYSVEYVRRLRKEYGLTVDEVEDYFTEMDEIDEEDAEEMYNEHFFEVDYNTDLPAKGRI
jgi:pyrroloquinoline quinone (PQQ) biosynthesis protein C